MFQSRLSVDVTLAALSNSVAITPQTAEAAAPVLLISNGSGPQYLCVETACTPAARTTAIPQRGISLPAAPYDAAAGFDFRFERNGAIKISSPNGVTKYFDLAPGTYPIGCVGSPYLGIGVGGPFSVKCFKYSGSVAPAADTTTFVRLTIFNAPGPVCTRQPTITGFRSLAAAGTYTADCPLSASHWDVWANYDLGVANPPILRARCGSATALRDYSAGTFVPPWGPIELQSTVSTVDYSQLIVSNAGLATADTFFRFTLAM